GNNKTVREISYALSYGVGKIVVDNLDELELISNISQSMNKTADILLRLKPGVDAHTHSFIRTGQIDSKFGLAIQTDEAMEAVEKAIKTPNINLKGFHCHIGSQIFDITPFEHAAEVMLGFIADVKEKFGYEIEELDLGGGFGIKYAEEDAPQPYENYMERVSKVVFDTCEKLGIKTPFIILEPGRSIVGEAGTTVYTVGAIKDIKDVRKYVSVDGGMCDNPRYALYEARYEASVANKANLPKNQIVTIAGKCCESGDLIGKDMPLGDVNVGDFVAVFSTGAYNYSMSSNYNRILKPAVLL
ncbi:MAG: diaminopimelate decarboxylase, partial [Oscillospiraceae bacterium]